MSLRTLFFAGLLAFVGGATVSAFANDPIVKWGGRGHDGGVPSRFFARPSAYHADQLEIWVNDAKTVREVGSMQIVAQSTIVSMSCQKAQRHVTAPWACLFRAVELRDAGAAKGKLHILDRHGKTLLQTDIDLARIAALAPQPKKETQP